MKKIIAEKGHCEYSIVIPENSCVSEETAAGELVEYIEKSLSVKLPVLTEEKASGKCIFVGQTAFAAANGIVGKSKENWIIAMVGENLVLTGGEKKNDLGIIFSVYHFLEEIVGVRWWSPWEEDVLELSELSLEDGFRKEGTPFFHHRKPYMHSQGGLDGYRYGVRMRANVISALDENIPDGRFDETVRKYGEVNSVGRPHQCHIMGKMFPVDEYYDEHPDWWAWNKTLGRHLREGHRCLTHKGFFEAFCNKYLAIIEEDVKLSEETGVELPFKYSLSLDDLLEYCVCQCPECEEIRNRAGYSGYVLDFANRVVREIGKKYPFAKFSYSAYLTSIIPPKDDTLPDKNIMVNIADVYVDLARKLSSPTNKKYREEVKNWADIVAKAGCGYTVWDYFYNIVLSYPLPVCNRITDTVRTWADSGIRGVFIETQNRFADFWELNKYLVCHLLEDPYLDEKALIDDFMNRYYGPAAEYAKEYLALLERKLDENLVTSMCCDEDSPFSYVDLETIVKGQDIFERALAAVGDAEPYRVRVEWLRTFLDIATIFRFFDYKKNAAKKGIEFNFSVAELKTRIFDAYDKHLVHPYNAKAKGSIAIRKAFIDAFPEEEEVFELPAELKGEKEEDIYQFAMCYMTKFSAGVFEKGYGASVVEDETSATGKVLKISYDAATGFRAPYTLIPTARGDENPSPLLFEIDQDGKTLCGNNLFKEDIKQGGYNLYKIGTVSDVMKYPDTRLRIPQEVNVNLRGIAVEFPMDTCDVYVSMKFTGEIYGGNKEDENAIYFERVVIVRK